MCVLCANVIALICMCLRALAQISKIQQENRMDGIMKQRGMLHSRAELRERETERLNERDETETAEDRCCAAKGQSRPPTYACIRRN